MQNSLTQNNNKKWTQHINIIHEGKLAKTYLYLTEKCQNYVLHCEKELCWKLCENLPHRPPPGGLYRAPPILPKHYECTKWNLWYPLLRQEHLALNRHKLISNASTFLIIWPMQTHQSSAVSASHSCNNCLKGRSYEQKYFLAI